MEEEKVIPKFSVWQQQRIAEGLAKRAHEGQVDKAGRPYFDHVSRVASAVVTPSERTVAFLHDILEDTKITAENLAEIGFSPKIVDAVQAITRRNHEEYMDYIRRLSENPLAKTVKIADLEDNMQLERLPDITRKDIERNVKYGYALKYLSST